MIDPGFEILNQRGTPMFFSDVFANRPTAGVVGRIFISTDTYAFYRDTGTTWDLIGGPGTGTITGTISAGQVAYGTAANTIGGSNNLFYDSSNARLGIGTASPQTNIQISDNKNGITSLQISNTTAGISSQSGVRLDSDASAGTMNIGKYSSTTSSYLSISSRDGYLSNASFGDITIQNEVATGRIKFSGGGASTSQMTLFSTGNLGIGVGLTDGGQRLQVSGTSLFTGASTFNSTITASSFIKSGGLSTEYLMADGSTSTLTNPVTGTGASGQVAYWSGTNTQTGSNNLFWDATNNRLGIGTNTPNQRLVVYGSGVGQVRLGLTDTNYWEIGRDNASTGDFIFTNFVSNSYPNLVRVTQANGRLIIGNVADSGERLQVNGTAKITGYSSFGSNLGAANQRIANFRNSGGNGYIELQSSGAGAVALWAAAGNEFAIYQNATAGTIGTNVFYITSTANIGISTFTPAYKLDVNGTFGAAGAATFSSSVTAQSFIPSGATIPTNGMFLPTTNTIGFATNSGGRLWIASNGNLGLGTAVPTSVTGSRLTQVIRGTSAELLIQTTNATDGTVNGFALAANGNDAYFVNRLDGFFAWITGSLGNTERMRLDASGNLLLGSSTAFTANERLQVTGTQQNKHTITYSTGAVQSFRIQKDLTIGSGATISTASTLSNAVFTGDNIFGGNVTIPESSPFANVYGANYYQFNAAGITITQTQATGKRTLTQYYAQNYFKGSNSGTITDMSSIQIAGWYNNNTGSITPIITNAYQLLIADIGEYGHTFTLTNRWGIYQEGASDRNYMAGKLMLNTTTDTGQRLQLNGSIRIDGQTSGTAGGASGQHLIINCDGTTYKIALLNN